MNLRCSICNSPLDEFGKCRRCEGPPDKPLGRIWALIVTVSVIAAIIVGTIYLNKYIGNPFEILKKLRRSNSYKVSRAAKDLPIARKPKESLTLEQYIGLREYFEDQQFGILNTVFGKYQEEFEYDVYNEYKIFDVCRVFRITLTGYEDIFESWLQFSPDHFAPYLARAHYFYENGWESRGYRLRKDTPDEQMQKMRHFFQKAIEDLNRALAINPELMPAYRVLLGVYNATGDDEGEYQTIEKALELFPESFLMRATYMWAIEPRWGGSYEQMEEFAKEAEAYYDMNPELTVLYGFIYSDQGKRLKSNEKYEHAEAYLERSGTYYHKKDFTRSLQDLKQACDLGNKEGCKRYKQYRNQWQ
jgi:tetratricopeptide (TPR) repeat protein